MVGTCTAVRHVVTAGADYVSINGFMLNFAPFTTTVCINLTIIDDSVEEKEEEVFMIGMTSLSKGAIVDQNAVLVTIIDDDCKFIISLVRTHHTSIENVIYCMP